MRRAESMDKATPAPTPALFSGVKLPIEPEQLDLTRRQMEGMVRALAQLDLVLAGLFFTWPGEAQLELPHRLTVETRLAIRAALDKSKALVDWLEMAEPK